MPELIKNSWHNQCQLSALRGMHPFRHTQSKMLIPASKFHHCSISSTTAASLGMAVWLSESFLSSWLGIDGDLHDRANNGCVQMDILGCLYSLFFIHSSADWLWSRIGSTPLVLLSFQFASGVQFLGMKPCDLNKKMCLGFQCFIPQDFLKKQSFSLQSELSDLESNKLRDQVRVIPRVYYSLTGGPNKRRLRKSTVWKQEGRTYCHHPSLHAWKWPTSQRIIPFALIG